MRIRVGTRGSALARAQTAIAIAALRDVLGDLEAEVVIVTTSGDRGAPLGRGAFTAELQHELAAGSIDVAVHSAKDLTAGSMEIVCLERGDPRDVLAGSALRALGEGARVGTSSSRRAAQLREVRPDVEVVPLRGNVDTRLEKVARGDVEAAMLAAAGLERIGRRDAIADHLDPSVFVPAPGQGAIVIEGRDLGWAAAAGHTQTTLAIRAERAFLHAVEGSCDLPLGALARVEGGEVEITGYVDGAGRTTVRRSDPEVAGTELAARLLGR